MDKPPFKAEVVPGSPRLYIFFGGINANFADPGFEFTNTSSSLPDSKLFVRDLRQAWYQLGLEGISADVDSTSEFLRQQIASASPAETVMVGNSMGGFAALLFASILGNCRAIAFAPQTFIGPFRRLLYRDSRWSRQMSSMYRQSILGRHVYDVRPSLLDSAGCRFDVFVSRRERRDMVHANHVRDVPNLTVHECDVGGHGLVKHLRNDGLLLPILAGDAVHL